VKRLLERQIFRGSARLVAGNRDLIGRRQDDGLPAGIAVAVEPSNAICDDATIRALNPVKV
jgi:hypothetical protein